MDIMEKTVCELFAGEDGISESEGADLLHRRVGHLPGEEAGL